MEPWKELIHFDANDDQKIKEKCLSDLEECTNPFKIPVSRIGSKEDIRFLILIPSHNTTVLTKVLKHVPTLANIDTL